MEQKNLVALMSRITEESNKLIVRELAAEGVCGIVPSHGGILMQLFSGQTFTMQELAEKIHRTKPTVTVLVGKLVDLGYVKKEKSGDDSRVTFIRLTTKGQALQPVFERVSAKLNTLVYDGVSHEETAFLQECLQAMLIRLT